MLGVESNAQLTQKFVDNCGCLFMNQWRIAIQLSPFYQHSLTTILNDLKIFAKKQKNFLTCRKDSGIVAAT